MIHSVTITNHLNEAITLELAKPEKSGFIVRDIKGLGPSLANINATEVATNDGALFTSARATSRNIVFTLSYLFDPTIEDVRQRSYKYFPIKRRIRIEVVTDNRAAYTYGYVESNEPNIFSSESGAQISVMCPDPYFYSARRHQTVFSGVESLFEFPFSNESLTENLIEISRFNQTNVHDIYYDGDSEAGMIITIHMLGTAKNITIYNTTTRESMNINTDMIELMTGSPLLEGDDILISTIRGSKGVVLLRKGVYINIFNAINRTADWFQLSKGSNIFAYTVDEGPDNLEFWIDNDILYEGM